MAEQEAPGFNYGQDLMFGMGPGGARKRKTLADRGLLPDGSKAKSPQEAQLVFLTKQRDKLLEALKPTMAKLEAIEVQIRELQAPKPAPASDEQPAEAEGTSGGAFQVTEPTEEALDEAGPAEEAAPPKKRRKPKLKEDEA